MRAPLPHSFTVTPIISGYIGVDFMLCCMLCCRYESTITSQLYGHTHNDEMQVFYDLPHLTRATGMAYIAPSLTTAPSLNPAYRVYTIDGFHQNTTFVR